MDECYLDRNDKDNLYELYSVADIVSIPSFNEQRSYVAIEMMMYGLPIIGTHVGMGEMVENDVTGLLVQASGKHPDRVEIDSSQLAEKILYLLKYPIEANGQNSRKRYLNNYSSEIFRFNMIKIYESCCCIVKRVKLKH